MSVCTINGTEVFLHIDFLIIASLKVKKIGENVTTKEENMVGNGKPKLTKMI